MSSNDVKYVIDMFTVVVTVLFFNELSQSILLKMYKQCHRNNKSRIDCSTTKSITWYHSSHDRSKFILILPLDMCFDVARRRYIFN